MIQLDNFVMMRWESEATVVPAESRFHNSFHQPHLCLICVSSLSDLCLICVSYVSHLCLICVSSVTHLCKPAKYIICSHFGFFAPGQVEAVQSLQETQLYQEDFIGDSYHNVKTSRGTAKPKPKLFARTEIPVFGLGRPEIPAYWLQLSGRKQEDFISSAFISER